MLNSTYATNKSCFIIPFIVSLYNVIIVAWQKKKLFDFFSSFHNRINPIRPGGGQYCPPNLWEALKQKLFESGIYNFPTIPKYVYTLTSNKKNVTCTLTGVLRGVSNWTVKICCSYFGHIYIFFWVLFIFYHVRCLNILLSLISFCGQKLIWSTLTVVLFRSHVLPVILYLARARADQHAHYSKCLNEVYIAYIINHISYNKL